MTNKVHQADDERHRHKEDHDGAMRRKDLVVVVGRQVALGRSDRDRLLRPHHDRVGKSAQQHDQTKSEIHHADALVVDAGHPLAPQVREPTLDGDGHQDGEHYYRHHRGADQRQRLIEWDRSPGQSA